MSGPITQIFDAVTAQLTSPILSELGEDKLANYDAAPRFTWIPRHETWSIARGGGAESLTSPKPLWQRAVQFHVYIWGSSIDEIDSNLLPMFINAAQKVAFGSVRPAGCDWTTGQSETVVSGALCILDIAFLTILPRLEPGITTANVGPLPITGELDALDGTTENSPP